MTVRPTSSEKEGTTLIRVTGHRGAADLAPENTLAGFRKAMDIGCHSVELDVQLTKDSRLAVIHNETIDHTTNGHGDVASFTMDELRQFDAGDGEHIPELDEVLDLLKNTDMSIQIELKGPNTERLAVESVKKRNLENRITFTSFFHQRVLEAGRLLPEATLGILIDSNPIDPIHMMSSVGARNLHVNHVRIDSKLVETVHTAGKTIVAWGKIVHPDDIDRLIDLGIDVIGSDRPDMVFDRLEKTGNYPV